MSQRVKKLPCKGKGEDGTQAMSKSHTLHHKLNMYQPFVNKQVQKGNASGREQREEGPKAVAEEAMGAVGFRLSLGTMAPQSSPRHSQTQPPKRPGLLATYYLTSKAPTSTIAVPRRLQPRYVFLSYHSLLLCRIMQSTQLVGMPAVIPQGPDLGHEAARFGATRSR